MTRVLIGLVLGVPLGWVAAEIARGWRAGGSVRPDPTLVGQPPPFAPEMAHTPRQPGEWL